jgi:plasmid maintenance system antidote protein VapI
MNKGKRKKRKKPWNVCDELRQAIQGSGWTHYRIGKEAGIKPEIVTRFVKEARDIRAQTFAKIAAALGMVLVPRKEGHDG